MTPGVVMLNTYARRQQTTTFFLTCWLKPTPYRITLFFTVPKHKVITSCFILQTLYGFSGIHLNDLCTLLGGKIRRKHFCCIVTYNSEAPEQHINVDEGTCIVRYHWPNALVICAQKVVLQPDCMWLHFGFVIAALVSHYSWKLRVLSD
jgi:hypothetical protein